MQSRVVLFCVFLGCFGRYMAEKCTVPLTNVKFSINSFQNATGHWNAQIELEHGIRKKEVWPWSLDVEQKTVKCGVDESLIVSANIKAPLLASETTISRNPPTGYQLISGLRFRGYYKLHTDLKTWYEALRSCEQEGAHLAIFNSEEEAKALSPLWDANPKIQDGGGNNWAHVGFHDLYQDKQYVTIFNESLSVVGYIKWIVGEPQEVIGQDCGVAFRRDNLIGDIGCDAKMPYFCEWEIR